MYISALADCVVLCGLQGQFALTLPMARRPMRARNLFQEFR